MRQLTDIALPLAWATDQVDPRMAVGVAGVLVALALAAIVVVNPSMRRAS